MVKEKRGASHVDIVFSFVIFITFLIFLFMIFKPFNTSQATGSDLGIIEKEILEKISVNMTTFSIKIDSSLSGETCFYMVSVEHEFQSAPLIIFNETRDIINTSESGGNTYFENFGNFYRFYYSEELNENIFSPVGCYLLLEEDYNISSIKFQEIASYSKIINLRVDYNNNYNLLKQELGLEKDFNIFIKNNPKINFNSGIKRPSNIDILAKNIPVTILDENANLNADIINIQVWG